VKAEFGLCLSCHSVPRERGGRIETRHSLGGSLERDLRSREGTGARRKLLRLALTCRIYLAQESLCSVWAVVKMPRNRAGTRLPRGYLERGHGDAGSQEVMPHGPRMNLGEDRKSPSTLLCEYTVY